MEQPLMLTVDPTSAPLKVCGEVDMSTAPKLIDAILDSSSTELDLSGITFIDSSGLHALLTVQAAIPSLRIVAVSPTLSRLVQLTGLADHLHVAIDA